MTSAESAGDRQAALKSLAGLSVGDAFGEQFFTAPADAIAARRLPPGPWSWTDDTHMALSIVAVLFEFGEIDPDALVRQFARRYREQPWRGYAGGAHRLLAGYARGADWRVEAPRLFQGGSYGNGAAMRAAPIGGYFRGEPERAAENARRSALVTHAHLEGQCGAQAVAAAAALKAADPASSGAGLLETVIENLPPSRTRAGIERALAIPPDQHPEAIRMLGTGQQVAAFDTVPYCLWVIACHGESFETALWITVAGLGDRDTTCAIVGGITGIYSTAPGEWLARREPLPEGFDSPEPGYPSPGGPA